MTEEKKKSEDVEEDGGNGEDLGGGLSGQQIYRIVISFTSSQLLGMEIPNGMGPVPVLGFIEAAKDFYLQRLHAGKVEKSRIVTPTVVPMPRRGM
jgi:hypothetical protein